MPKTRDAFALRRLYEGIKKDAPDEMFYPFAKGFDEPDINVGVDRIGSVEQCIRRCEHGLNRAKFLIKLINRHVIRLAKIISSYDPFDVEKFSRAVDLEQEYRRLKNEISGAAKYYRNMRKENLKILRYAFNQELGIKLRLARRRYGLTQDAIAKALGITTVAYSHYENGRRELPPAFLYRLTKLFGVSESWLLGLEK